MRALTYAAHGRPVDVLRLDDLPTPAPGPGEVRVRLTHRPVHPSDLSAIRGTYGASRPLPATAGNEGLGVVDAVGPDADSLGADVPAVGQRVVKLGDAPTWADAVVLPAADVWPVPDDVPDDAAAQLFVNALTAVLLLEAASGLAPGDVVVQTAGASTVARCVTALAARRGLRTVAVVRSSLHATALAADGAAVVVADADAPEARAALADAVGPGGAAAVFDAVAGAAGALALSALADGGTHVVYGALSGQPLAVPPSALIYRRAAVRGVWRSRWVAEAPRAEVVRRLDALAPLAAAGVLPLPVQARVPLAGWRDALAAAAAPGRLGKVLLVG